MPDFPLQHHLRVVLYHILESLGDRASPCLLLEAFYSLATGIIEVVFLVLNQSNLPFSHSELFFSTWRTFKVSY